MSLRQVTGAINDGIELGIAVIILILVLIVLGAILSVAH